VAAQLAQEPATEDRGIVSGHEVSGHDLSRAVAAARIDGALAPETPRKADRSPDIEGVHRIFTALSAFLDAVSAQFQIIVTEHAGSITWRGVQHVHLVGNWREGHDQFLIPDAWIPRQ